MTKPATLAQCREERWDVFFFGTDERRANWIAGQERETVAFDEPAGPRTLAQFVLKVAAVAPRPRPVIKIAL